MKNNLLSDSPQSNQQKNFRKRLPIAYISREILISIQVGEIKKNYPNKELEQNHVPERPEKKPTVSNHSA